MKKILVPSDFSKTAGRALNFALHIAARTGAELTVLHVIGPFEGVNNNVYDAFWLEQYEAQRKLDLQKWADKHTLKTAAPNVIVHTNVEIGFTIDTIADMGKEHHFDLIVMGSTGSTGLKGLFLGSTAGGVIGKSKLPIMAVPRKAVFKKMGRVVLATDFEAELDKKSLATLRSLLEIGPASLDVLHVLAAPGEQPDEKSEANFRKKFDGMELRFNYNFNNDVPTGIANFLENEKTDLVCTIAHPHGVIHRLFVESTSKLLANQTDVPLLVLHD